MRVLVTGATGLIGQQICEELRQEGHETVILSRRPSGVKTGPGITAYAWDPEQGNPPAEAWDGVDAVIHLAGEPVAGARWTNDQKRRIRDSRVTGTKNLVDGMKGLASRPRVFISASAVGFYGDRGEEDLDERSSPGNGFLSDVCREWEDEALKAEQAGIRVGLVRIGVVLSREGGALEKMLLPFKLGLGGQLGDGRQWFPWIHVDDIVGIFKHALVNENVRGPINGVAPGIVSNAEFTKQFAGALNRSVFFPVPAFAMRMMMGEMAIVVLSSQKVVPKVALDTGYDFKFPQLGEALNSFQFRVSSLK